MATARNADRLLEVENLDVAYGPIQVVWDITLSVRRGEVVSLIGPNGAGKTTTLRALAGILPTRKGKINFNGREIGPDPPHRRGGPHPNLVPGGRAADAPPCPRLEGGANTFDAGRTLAGARANHGGPSLRADMQNRQGGRHDSARGAKCQLCAADFQSHVRDGMGKGAARGAQ